MADPLQHAEAAERDAESAELYAPPRDDKAVPSDPFAARPQHSPGLVGFVTLLITSTVCSAIAAGFMVFWYNITPIKSGFLSGLEEFVLAFLGWGALSLFALLAGILLAAGILGREGKPAPFAWALTVVLAILAGLVCFIPEPKSTFGVRGVLGLVSEAISFGLTMIVLRFARRRYIGPPPPPPWMAG